LWGIAASILFVQETTPMSAETSKPVLQTAGNYDLLEKIAEGGMGTVYKGRDRASGNIVAVKLVSPQMATNPVFLQRFEKEYNVARSLDHPNIVRALDYGNANGRPFLVMEFVEGESLGQRIEREGPYTEAEAVRITVLAAQGLQKAHKQGLIHRDVKPDNIMVTPAGQVKLADLGLVKELETDINLTRTGRGLGTPHFMAPEQFKNAKNADIRCDVYSLAATLYMMVTGKMPFQSSGPLDAWMKKVNNELIPPRKINPAISERTDMVIRTAMNPDPEQRPGSCREFVEELTGQSTRKLPVPKAEGPAVELWYLLYKDLEGQPHMVKGTIAAIRRSLKEGLLGDASNVKASKTKTGTFELLQNIAEFKELVQSLLEEQQAKQASASKGKHTPPEDSAVSSKGRKKAGPHIPLETKAGSPEWLKILVFIAIAVGTGVFVAALLSR
jgi:serine/threonine protein kinase